MSKNYFYAENIAKTKRFSAISESVEDGYIMRYDGDIYFVIAPTGCDIGDDVFWSTIENECFVDQIEIDDDDIYYFKNGECSAEEILNICSMDASIATRVLTKKLDNGSLTMNEKKLEVGDCYESRGVGMIISKIIGDNVYSSEVAYDENDIPYAVPGTESLLTDYEILKIKI